MKQLPITLVFFTSTKGHHGRKTDWRLTLNHWDKQVPLSRFNLVAHIKVTPGEEGFGLEMEDELRKRGFHVVQTIGSWHRGLSHGAAYLGDQVTVSKDKKVYERPYLLFLEDDSPVLSHQLPLEDLLLQSCQKLADNHEMLTTRVMRRHDDRGPTVAPLYVTSTYFWSQDVNFQPLLMRSLDFYRLCLALEAHPEACQNVQCERLWRLILDSFSRSSFKHLVYEPDFAEALHIGAPQADHEAIVKQHNLT